LKRLTPSFTVEHRQARRPSGSAKPGWAHAKPAPAGVDGKANQIAASAFKTVAAQPPADVISPPIPTGRILPSLVEAAALTRQADAEGARSRGYGSAAEAGHAAQAPGDGTVARHFGDHAYPAKDLEPSVAVAPILRLEQPTTLDLSVEKTGTPRSEKPTRRSTDKQERLHNDPRTFAEGCEPAPVSSTSGLPPVGKPSSTTRTSRILSRYVFRDELTPGESWKRRLEARRERRA
jgi:hypothetical protein